MTRIITRRVDVIGWPAELEWAQASRISVYGPAPARDYIATWHRSGNAWRVLKHGVWRSMPTYLCTPIRRLLAEHPDVAFTLTDLVE